MVLVFTINLHSFVQLDSGLGGLTMTLKTSLRLSVATLRRIIVLNYLPSFTC